MTIEETIAAAVAAQLKPVLEELRALRAEMKPTTAAQPGDHQLPVDSACGVAEVAAFLGWSESMVRKVEQDGRLPSLPRIGRRLNFDPAVVRSFRAGTLKLAPRLAQKAR